MNMGTHGIDVEAQIHFCPESQHMRISFSGGECAGMPPFSNELLDLAVGAQRVTFDLRGLQLTNPEATVQLLLVALGREESDPGTEIITSDATDGDPLQGAYYVG